MGRAGVIVPDCRWVRSVIVLPELASLSESGGGLGLASACDKADSLSELVVEVARNALEARVGPRFQVIAVRLLARGWTEPND